MPVKNLLFLQRHSSKFIYLLGTLKAWNRNKKDRISTSTVPEKPETTEVSFIWSFARWISPTYYHFTVGMNPETRLCPGDKSDQQTNHSKKQKYHHHLRQERCTQRRTRHEQHFPSKVKMHAVLLNWQILLRSLFSFFTHFANKESVQIVIFIL